MKPALLLLLLGCSPFAAHASSTAELGLRLLLGEPTVVNQIDSSTTLVDKTAPTSLNLHFSQPLGSQTNFFGNFSHTATNENPVQGMVESSITAFQGGVEWMFGQPQKMQWFLLGGLSGMHIQNGNKQEALQPVASFGVGQNWTLGAQDTLRWELRANQNLGNDNQPSWTPVNFQAIFSYQWGN